MWLLDLVLILMITLQPEYDNDGLGSIDSTYIFIVHHKFAFYFYLN